VGRILIDYLRNARSATAIEAFSTRARPGATVALPVAWEALATELTPGSFTVRNVGEHLERLESDPWEAYSATRQVIDAEMRRELGLE
jgi:bifunctional non-homologous end joining protein LigD